MTHLPDPASFNPLNYRSYKFCSFFSTWIVATPIRTRTFISQFAAYLLICLPPLYKVSPEKYVAAHEISGSHATEGSSPLSQKPGLALYTAHSPVVNTITCDFLTTPFPWTAIAQSVERLATSWNDLQQ